MTKVASVTQETGDATMKAWRYDLEKLSLKLDDLNVQVTTQRAGGLSLCGGGTMVGGKEVARSRNTSPPDRRGTSMREFRDNASPRGTQRTSSRAEPIKDRLGAGMK